MGKDSAAEALDGNGRGRPVARVLSLNLTSLLVFAALVAVVFSPAHILASEAKVAIAGKTYIHHPPAPGKPGIKLTSAEKAWLDAHPVVRVMGETDYPPWDFIQEGRPAGYGIDYVTLLTDRLGLTLEFVVAPYGEHIKNTANRELDIMHTAQSGLHEKILFSKPYGSFLQMVFTREDQADIKTVKDLSGKRVAIIKGDAAQKTLHNLVPGAVPIESPGYLQALVALHNKAFDAAVMDFAVGDHLIRKHLLSGLKATTTLNALGDDIYQYMRLGVRSDWPELLALLEKAMDTVTAPELDALSQKWLKALSRDNRQIQLTQAEQRFLDAHPLIRVGSSADYAPFNFRLAGKPAGYSIDLIKLLAESLGIDLAFVPAPVSGQMEMIQHQELDLMAGVYDIPEWSGFLNLTQPYKSADLGIFIQDGRKDIKSLGDLAGKTVSLVKGDALTAALTKRYPDMNQVLTDDYSGALRSVALGTADATILQIAVGTHLAREKALGNIKIAGGINAREYLELGYHIESYHIGMRKDWPELAAILNKALNRVTRDQWRKLDEQWLSRFSESTKLVLLPGEKAWLLEHPVIRVASDPNWMPIEFRDKKGRYQGLSIDYLKTIESMLNIRFEFVRENWQELIVRAKKQEVDIFTCVAETPEREAYLSFTEPYIQMPVGIFASEDAAYISDLNTIAEKKIAVVEGYATHDYLGANYPDMGLVLVKTPEQGVSAILEEKAFAFIGNVITTGNLIRRKGYTHIHLRGEIPFVYAQSMGVRKDWPMLRNILQKTLDAVPYGERDAIYNKWVPLTHEKPVNYRLFWQIGGGCFLLILLVVIWNRRLASEVYKRTLALQASEKRYRDFFTKSLQGTWCYKMDPPMPTDIPVEEQVEWTFDNLVLEECNDLYARMYGYTLAGDIIGMRSVEVFGGAEEVARNAIRAWIDSGYAFHVSETREQTRYGTEKWFIRSGLSFMENGKLVRTWGNQIDITERKQAEETHFKLITAIEQASESFVITDKDAAIQYVNPGFEQLTGYTKEEVLGQNPRILKSGRQSDRFYREMWETLQKGHAWKGHLVNRKKDGSLFEEDATITPILDNKGHISNYIAVKRDITDQIKVQKQLQQAQKMEGIGTLAGGIAHDFNNILTAILGYSEIALEDIPADTKVHSNIAQVMNAGNRARELVKQILTFSRQENQELKPLRVQFVIKEALKLLRSSIPATIEIRQDIDPDCGVVLADPTQIHQVLMNLCTNAYHAMRKTGGILGISLKPVELTREDVVNKLNLQSGAYLRLVVSDTGHGITQEVRERMFEPYYSTKAKGEGTGLGLAMVHGIITGLQGDITVYSEPGKGTTFHIYLPIIKDVVESIPKEDTAPLPTGSERILLVDDDQSIASLHKAMFEKLGYQVAAFTKSGETLRVFEEKPEEFDIVVTDMTMPNMTGEELARKMLAIRPELPIILCTGYSELINKEKAKAMGIRDYVMKPIIKKELARAVRKALDAG